MEGYCEKHGIAKQIKAHNGSWFYECPRCREQGFLNVYYDVMAKVNEPINWTVSNKTVERGANEKH